MMIDDKLTLFFFLKKEIEYQTSSKTLFIFIFYLIVYFRQLRDGSQSSMIMMVNCSLIGSSSSSTTSIPTRQTCPLLSRVVYACVYIKIYWAIGTALFTRKKTKHMSEHRSNKQTCCACRRLSDDIWRLIRFIRCIYQNEQDKTLGT